LHHAHARHAIPAVQVLGGNAYLRVTIQQMEGHMNLFRNYRNWRRMRTTISELNRLSSRELNDIGITRADIARVARLGS
jgi:uncharacterized protein YjiS (DUF1127 family)